MLGIANLRTLVTVVESGGIRAAAIRLGRTPSAVSMALKQLEGSVGVPLFEGERKTRPTPICQQMIEKSRELLDHYDGTCAAINAIAQNEAHRCTIASIALFATSILPIAVHKLKNSTRTVEVNIREASTDSIMELVTNAKVDVGFVKVAASRPDLRVAPLLRDSYLLVCRADDPLARYDGPIPWSALDGREFIRNDCLSDIDSPEVLRELSQARFFTRSKFQTSSVLSTFSLVRGDIGVALLPGLCMSEAPAELRFLPLADARVSRVVSMVTKKGRRLSSVSTRVIKSIRSVVHECAKTFGYDDLDRTPAPEHAVPGDIVETDPLYAGNRYV